MSKYVGFRLGKVHESHVISEYYCGGCGWPVTDHDSFCPECGGAFRECDASNLEAENAKLRELVRELWRTMDLLNACDVSEYDEPLNCIYCEQWGTVGKNIVGCKLKYRMRELEVDA